MATKKLFVFVPSNNVVDFKTAHTGSGITASDVYYDKVAFLADSGEIATHGQLFGMSAEFANKIGLTSDITTSNTLMSYITAVKNAVGILNANDETTGSVDKKVKDAIDSLVAGAPTAYDTITEIAAWINDIQGQQGTAATVAATLAKVGTLETAVGSVSGSDPNYSYTGLYAVAHEYAQAEATSAVNSLNTSHTAASGKYISSIALSNGTWTISDSDLPTLSIASGSANYLTVNDHEIGVTTSTISSTTGFVHNTTGTAYTIGSAETIGNGLVTASDVYNRLRADETFIASALSTIDARISTVVAGATGDLDSTLNISDSGSYISATIVEQDGKLITTGSSITFDVAKIYDELDSTLTITASENSTTYGSATIVITDGKLNSTGSSMTINKANILAKTSATVDSPTTGTGANEYVEVHVTTENHDVTAVTVDFDPWETYSS